MKNFLIKSSISLSIVAFSYLLSIYTKFNDVFSFFSPSAIRSFANQYSAIQHYPYLPVMAMWGILGIFLYFTFYSLQVVYTDIYNFVLAKVYYKNSDIDFDFMFKTSKKLIMHSIIITTYVLTTVIFVIFPFPATNVLRLYAEKYIVTYPMLVGYSFFLSFVPAYIYWFIIFTFVFVIYRKIFTIFVENRFNEEKIASYLK